MLTSRQNTNSALDDEEEVGQMIDTFAPRKKRKVVEHSEFDSMNVEDTSTSDFSAISSVAIDKMFKKYDLTAKLQEQGLSVIDNPGNGDCLPYSLIDYLHKVRDYNGNFQTLQSLEKRSQSSFSLCCETTQAWQCLPMQAAH
eukprot:TRINITY_DN15567_c0_g1_i1.p1 TRINITY_DN15567_c0_g1~~TRINITY_DN15567_c0_g1_i1.p1  ORF type:complete len:142 (-),score=6.77 TRINITY_DN15567_c0_g1_i1:347-772(-)